MEFLVKKQGRCFARETKLYPLYVTVIHMSLNEDLGKENLTKEDKSYYCLRQVCRVHKAGKEKKRSNMSNLKPSRERLTIILDAVLSVLSRHLDSYRKDLEDIAFLLATQE